MGDGVEQLGYPRSRGGVQAVGEGLGEAAARKTGILDILLVAE